MNFKLIDPLKMIEMCWPDIQLYDRQKEMIYHVDNTAQTYVPAGNKLGKDFVSGLIAVTFFVRRHPCRVVTTSVDQGQLEKVLWGEIGRFITTSKVELPIKWNFLDIKKIVQGQICPRSYLVGRVAKQEEGLLGHHLEYGPNGEPLTLMIYDEASGVQHGFKDKTDTWAHRTLVIGNPFPTENFFKQDTELGDIPIPGKEGKFHRKVIRIRGEDSPNVRYGLAEERAGKTPSDRILIPGVLTYGEYKTRRALWDKIRQCISLDAEFYKGKEVLMYPPDWLNNSEQIAASLHPHRIAKAMGVDPAEGGDSSVWTVVDELGVIAQFSEKTKDTSVIPIRTKELMIAFSIPAHMVIFDAGGGGKQHADAMRRQGIQVRTVGFGESATPPPKRSAPSMYKRAVNNEMRFAYKNRRAEMYHLLRLLIDPTSGGLVFGIPSRYEELRRQLSPIPLLYEKEAVIAMPPKRKTKDKPGQSLEEIIGRSPDEADSLVLAVWGMMNVRSAGSIGAL